MFTGLNQRVLEKLHEIEGKITGSKHVPHNKIIGEARVELEQIFEGQGSVNFKYAKETVSGLEYAKNVHHHDTNNTLLEDIVNGKRIDFYDYR
ncbi:hypothetical protein [Pontibacillus litoralis]|uniref:Uncharacterized protein n=1 Tax=Pontibacillus litoralis JSM 072002 TaxID=1385512 RepID=A0A0A5FTP2_9BACI|nr:hypothetical protein [Pontibacillus litoralis]KGX84131.1 hypothetical protein N784_14570 [Pontibacillus litoralis JSM 072002]